MINHPPLLVAFTKSAAVKSHGSFSKVPQRNYELSDTLMYGVVYSGQPVADCTFSKCN